VKITQLVKKISAVREIASENLESVPYSIRPGLEMAKNQAALELTRLTGELGYAVLGNMGGIYLSGKPESMEQFKAIAEDEGAAICVDCNGLYKTIVNQVFTGNAPGVFKVGINQVGNFVNAVFTLNSLLGFRGPNGSFGHCIGREFTSFDEAVDFVKKEVRMQYGDDLNVLFLRHGIVNRVVASDYEQNVVPVVVSNASQEEVTGTLNAYLFGDANLVVDAGESCDKAVVIRAFRDLKGLLKNTRKVE
jgi:hypothetical protein